MSALRQVPGPQQLTDLAVAIDLRQAPLTKRDLPRLYTDVLSPVESLS